MAITQKHKVSFMVKSVVPTETVDYFVKNIREAARAIMDGEEHYQGQEIDGRMKHIIELFTTGGMDAVLSFMLRDEMRNAIQKLSSDYSDGHFLTVSPAVVRKVGQ